MTIEWGRIRHLLKLGCFAALIVLTADMILGWGTFYDGVPGLPPMWARFLLVSDGRIIASAILGLIAIPLECLCWFAVYRMIKPFSEKDAHDYRAGIIGCFAFGGCGVHVPCCMAAFLLKRFYELNPDAVVNNMKPFLIWFLLPAAVIFLVFFMFAAVVQIRAIAKGNTPLPKWCWIFNILIGIPWIILMRIIGDYPITNALAAAWISIGNLWMMGGLLVITKGKEES